MCHAESQMSGSLPLLNDLVILCEMEHKGRNLLEKSQEAHAKEKPWRSPGSDVSMV